MLRGNLAPGGALIKQSAADPALMEHEGRAVVFEDAADLAARIDDPALDVTADDVLVLKNIGPKGAPGMPEAGYLPIPKKLARAGREGHGAHLRRPHERHRLRHHRAARHARGRGRRAAGASAQTATASASSVARRELTLLVADAELAARAAAQPGRRADAPSAATASSSCERVTQADQGVDFDFLQAPQRTRRIPGD